MNLVNIDGPRRCKKEELPQVIALVDDEMRQGTGQTMLTDYPLVYQDANLENIHVIAVGGKIVSVVPFIPRQVTMDECRFIVGIISPTATHPDHRKKGYAMQCLNQCLKKMDESGIDLSVLWTKIETFPFYEKTGYQAARSQGWIYRCSNQDARLFKNHGEEIVAYNPKNNRYIKDIQAMHEREIYGILRTPEEYPALFGLPKTNTLIALRNGLSEAYLVVSRSINKPGILEGGGKETAVETLMNRALSGLKDNNYLDVHDNLTETTPGNLLRRKMPERKQPPEAGPMMIRINNVGGFFHKIAKALEKQNVGGDRKFSITVTDTDEVISLKFSDDGLNLGTEKLDYNLEVTRRELTSIIFGAHPSRPVKTFEVLNNLFPLYFPIWILDHS